MKLGINCWGKFRILQNEQVNIYASTDWTDITDIT
jgi:hypothetical protein